MILVHGQVDQLAELGNAPEVKAFRLPAELSPCQSLPNNLPKARFALNEEAVNAAVLE